MTPVTRLLFPLSLLFHLVMTVRRALYRLRVLPVSRMAVPVVVVGNINAGGSGKTPLVLWIVEYLQAAGHRPGIVSRGHGGRIAARRESAVEVSTASDPATVGDEPLLLARRAHCPVWVGADRAAACRALLVHHPECDVVVLDDGLQHYALARDVEIAVVDSRGFGNGHLLPAGPLREPVSRLSTVDAVVYHGGSGSQGPRGFSMRLEGVTFVNLANGSRATGAGSLGSKRIHAVAGVGDPPRFFRHLEALGFDVLAHAFADHHAFAAADFAFDDRLPVVMTEKDAVKCTGFAEPHFWMLPVRAELDAQFGPMLDGLLQGKLRQQPPGKRSGP